MDKARDDDASTLPASEPAAASAPALSLAREPSRNVQLDGLRGVAILLVLFTHNVVEPRDAGALAGPVGYLRYLGPTGVDLFFVLSGFLIGSLLFKEIRDTGRLDAGRFLVRRAFRIWPSYFAFIAFVFAWMILVERKSAAGAFEGLLPNLLHVQNYFGSPRQHTWSLAVEEHFYLVLPFLLAWLAARRAPAERRVPGLVALACGIFVAGALLRLYTYSEPRSFNPHFVTHLRVDSLFFGVLLAYLQVFEPRRLAFAANHRAILVALGVALLLTYPVLVMERNLRVLAPFGFAQLYVGYGCLLLALVHGPLPGGWIGRRLSGRGALALAYIGYFSYPMYLWHIDAALPVDRVLRAGLLGGLAAELRWVGAFALYVIVALGVAVLVTLLLDKPLLAYRDRVFPSRVK